MFSPLAKGVGTWTGDFHRQGELYVEKVLPVLPIDEEYHPHGITISPRLCTAPRGQHSEKPNGELILPKTFITRKGALMLFTAPDDFDKLTEDDKLYMKKAQLLLRQQYAEEITKLGKLSRLAQSILIFGDEDYSPEDASISDADNKIMLGFLHNLDTKPCDERSRPGSDLSFYLRDLRSRRNSARSSFSYADGRKSHQSFLAPTTLSVDSEQLISKLRPDSAPGNENKCSCTSFCRPSRRVLSADKLRASIKSNSYLGRPSPSPAALEEERVSYPFTPPGSCRSSTTTVSYRHTSIPLLEHRHKSRLPIEGIELMPQSEHIRRYLEDIQSEDIREENESCKNESSELLSDDLQAKCYEEYEELNLYDGQSLDGTSVQLKKPLYSSNLTEATGQFSADNMHVENIDDVSDEAFFGDLSDRSHNMQDSSLPNLSVDSDSDILGVTAVEITNSRRGSNTSSNSGIPLDKKSLDVSEELPKSYSSAVVQRAKTARGHRVRSAIGPRKQVTDGEHSYGKPQHDEEECPNVAQAAPPAPPCTRTASPSITQVQDDVFDSDEQNSATLELDTSILDMHRPQSVAEDDGGADIIEQSPRYSDSICNKDNNARPLVRGEENVEGGSAIVDDSTKVKDVCASEQTNKKQDEDDDRHFAKSDSHQDVSRGTVVEEVKHQIDKIHGEDHSETKLDLPAKDTSHLEDLNQGREEKVIKATEEYVSEAKELDLPRVSKVMEKPKDKVKSEKKDAIKNRATSKVSSSINETAKQYSKDLDVSKINSTKKTFPAKKEPLLKGLESYVMNTKKGSIKKVDDANKKPTTQGQPSDVRKSHNLLPSPPLKTKEEIALDELEKEVTELLDSKTTDMAYSAEEMLIEQQLLQERLKAAEQRVKCEQPSSQPRKLSNAGKKTGKKGKNKKVTPDNTTQEELAKRREVLREARKLEKMKRLEEAKQLEAQIKEKEEARRQAEAEAAKKTQGLQEQIEMMAREAAEARQLEEKAREEMALQKRKAREEREARRKAELERKKQEAAKHREHEKKMMEAARHKEHDMLENIADAEHKHMIEEEERRKREEQELLEEQQKEAEERELERQAEEEEAKLRELEQQAEEEALAFLIREREEAEAQQRALEERVAWERHQQELQRKQIEEEKAKLEEQKRKQEEEERKKLEEEQRRFEEIQKAEQEALERLRREMDEKRAAALQRREQNLDRRTHLSRLAHGQGMTRPWIFTYYVHWPRETYEKKMGQEPKKKSFRSAKKAKPK